MENLRKDKIFKAMLMALAVGGIFISCSSDPNSSNQESKAKLEQENKAQVKKIEQKNKELDKTMDELDKEFGQ